MAPRGDDDTRLQIGPEHWVYVRGDQGRAVTIGCASPGPNTPFSGAAEDGCAAMMQHVPAHTCLTMRTRLRTVVGGNAAGTDCRNGLAGDIVGRREFARSRTMIAARRAKVVQDHGTAKKAMEVLSTFAEGALCGQFSNTSFVIFCSSAFCATCDFSCFVCLSLK